MSFYFLQYFLYDKMAPYFILDSVIHINYTLAIILILLSTRNNRH